MVSRNRISSKYNFPFKLWHWEIINFLDTRWCDPKYWQWKEFLSLYHKERTDSVYNSIMLWTALIIRGHTNWKIIIQRCCILLMPAALVQQVFVFVYFPLLKLLQRPADTLYHHYSTHPTFTWVQQYQMPASTAF